ncbi:hypothetical protein ROZALSC1DRAFT_25517 [Rozella allomycis CSF55]|uniref:Uncharacterized protein n=1 Tax=Rozella allomycis (strain CSF55) TaxID=988480 RepID=A0A4P9YAJ7_ROZAC|nr:hypothetical protein ROZALSC1DRAFT_25517 [Rozella allomycis CSF55]
MIQKMDKKLIKSLSKNEQKHFLKYVAKLKFDVVGGVLRYICSSSMNSEYLKELLERIISSVNLKLICGISDIDIASNIPSILYLIHKDENAAIGYRLEWCSKFVLALFTRKFFESDRHEATQLYRVLRKAKTGATLQGVVYEAIVHEILQKKNTYMLKPVLLVLEAKEPDENENVATEVSEQRSELKKLMRVRKTVNTSITTSLNQFRFSGVKDKFSHLEIIHKSIRDLLSKMETENQNQITNSRFISGNALSLEFHKIEKYYFDNFEDLNKKSWERNSWYYCQPIAANFETLDSFILSIDNENKKHVVAFQMTISKSHKYNEEVIENLKVSLAADSVVVAFVVPPELDTIKIKSKKEGLNEAIRKVAFSIDITDQEE